MIHAFLLVVVLGGEVVSSDMYFESIDRCNYFASEVTKRYGNYQHLYSVPEEHKATAYCRPVKVDPKKIEVY